MKVSVQDVVPVAACHVSPSSVETSTPATRPPPESVAVPVTVIDWPLGTLAGVGGRAGDGDEVAVLLRRPAAGVVIETVGPAVSVDFVAASSPVISVVGLGAHVGEAG